MEDRQDFMRYAEGIKSISPGKMSFDDLKNLDPLALSMLSNNEFNCLIQIEADYGSEGLTLNYDLEGLSPIEKGRLWDEEKLIKLIRFMKETLDEAEIFLIRGEDLSWSLDNIYMSDKGFKFLYLPILGVKKEGIGDCLRNLIALSRFDPEKSTSLLREILNGMEEGDFNDGKGLARFLSKYDSINEDGKKNQKAETIEDREVSYEVKIEKANSFLSKENLISVEETDEGLSYTERAYPPRTLSTFKEGKEESMGLFHLLTHFSMENWKKYRAGRKETKGEGVKKVENYSQTRLLPSASKAYIWWVDRKKPIALDKLPFSIGSDGANGLVINNPYISRKHAMIEKKSGQIFLVNLSDTNGTFLNKKEIKRGEKMELSNSDNFSLANENFIYFS